jgi:hypothetical protein
MNLLTSSRSNLRPKLEPKRYQLVRSLWESSVDL